MKAYLARLNADQRNPREIVGLFVAEDLPMLYDLIDECCDVEDVEVLELGPGGIYWPNAVNFIVPYPEDGREEAPGLPGGASTSDHWLGALFDENEAEWKQIEIA